MKRIKLVLVSGESGELIHSMVNKKTMSNTRENRDFFRSLSLCSLSNWVVVSHTQPYMVLPYMCYVGMCRCEGYVFQSESLGLEKGIIFHLN